MNEGMKPNKFLRKRSGIYGIRNLINNKIYVGRTVCMYRRCHQYVNLKEVNPYLLNAFGKIGIDNFDFFPLEFCDIALLVEREIWWMKHLRSHERNFGYNLRSDESGGMVPHAETREKISRNLKTQWALGVRGDHGQKLKDNWKNNPDRRKQQSDILSKIKTKFEYEIHYPNGDVEFCMYVRLKELGLKNCITEFHRKKSNDIKYLGHRIIRHSRGERG